MISKERKKEYDRARYLANREAIRAARSTPEVRRKERDRARANRRANPEAYRAAVRRYKAANRAELNERQREARRNPEYKVRRRDESHRRRARQGVSSPELRRLVAELVSEPCRYCGSAGPIEIDHIVPLSRGGKHEPENLAPACRSCNRSKGAKLLSEWKVSCQPR